MDLLDIAIAKQLAGGGGGSGTDNYNDLSNLPKINDTTLSGNKTSANLGLQSEINSDSKLASDLVDDTDQDNKFVTTTEKTTWNGKQNAIDADHKINADYVDDSTSTNKFVTASDKETWNAKQNAIDNSHKLSSDLVDDTNHTNKFVTSTEKQTWNAKQNAIDADHKLSSSLVSFTTAEAAALASGIDSSKVGQISTNQSNILYALDNGAKNLLKIIRSDASSQAAISDDGSITVNHSAVSGNFTIHFFTDDNDSVGYKPLPTEWIGKYFSGVTTYVEGATLLMEFSDNGINWSDEIGVNSPNTKAKIPSTHPYYRLGLKFNSQVAVTNYVLKPMIADEIVYDTVGADQPYALPNYDLTHLEAEDRAALAEEIDAGAKNLIAPNPVTYPFRGMTLTYSENGIQVTGTGSENPYTYIHVGTITITAGMTYVLYDPSYASSNTAYFYVDSATAFGVVSPGIGAEPQYLVAKNSGTYNIYLRSPYNVAVNKLYKPMICTKAAFGVSNKFVPYRPNYDLVGTNINKLLGTLIKTTYSSTAANTYEYANIAIPLTNTKVYEIMASTMHSSTAVKGIILASNSTTLTGGYYIFAENDGNGNVGLDGSLSVHCIVPPYGANTIYVWVKYEAANKSNAIAVWYREIG